MELSKSNSQRKTQAEKNAHDFKWYKDQANLLCAHSQDDVYTFGYGNVSDYRRMKTNYDLFNGIVDMTEFNYVCQPFGADGGELPANFAHRDILANKIKVLLGMEMTMPFSWKIFAVNREATTRIEQESFKRVRGYVEKQVMAPIKFQIEAAAAQQAGGRELNAQEKLDLQKQINEQVEAQTPDEIRKYMSRDHQDPAEVMLSQLLEYLIWKTDAKEKFQTGWKHANLSGKEIYWVGEVSGKPDFTVINPLFFRTSKAKDQRFIDEGEWAVYELRMTPADIVKTFGHELDSSQIDQIYEFHRTNPGSVPNATFTFTDSYQDTEEYTISVYHCNWIGLRKIGFVTDQDGNEKIVDELYQLDEEAGDVSVEWQWITEAHEVYKILQDIFVYARPVPGQLMDLDNLNNARLSYFGMEMDSLNSPTTCPMDRGKSYQYLYDIIMYRIELLMASDEGKKMLFNINMIPKSAGIDLNKWMYFFKANNLGFMNPSEEGNRQGDTSIANAVKEVDMSLISDINKYIQLAEYIEKKCGKAIGVTDQMEGSIGPSEAVTNTKQNLMQASYVVRPAFEMHNIVKGRVLNALLETGKAVYSQKPPLALNYVLDDMSMALLTLDPDLLSNSTWGMFLSNSAKDTEIKMAIDQLAQAAMQNQQADIGDVIKVMRSDSATEADELLDAAKRRKEIEVNSIEMNKIKSAQELQQRQEAAAELAFEREKELIVLKESERRKTEIQKQTILSLGFNEDKDLDKDNVPDVLEVAKFGVDAQLQGRKEDREQAKQDLEREKFQHQKKIDSKKLKQEDEKIQIQRNKPTTTK